jgi:glycosyltransferase involved in cell wall biosynthesis
MDHTMSALIIVFSEAHSDPRVRHQITWLVDDGWTVDTIGWGGLPSLEVNEHFDLLPQSDWVQTRWGSALTYGFFPLRHLFRTVTSNRIPRVARERLHDGAYDLVIFDDFDFLPIIKDPAIFSPAAAKTHIHLDLHEYHSPSRRLNSAWRYLTRRFYVWQRGLIGDSDINSRSTVASRIADMYSRDFTIKTPALVRNCPPYEDQQPSDLEAGRVRLLYHGLASASRGLAEMVEAMAQLEERFSLTFMLTGNEPFQAKLRSLAKPLGERINFVPPVAMPEIAAEINKYDLEVMFYRPLTANLEFALPNKLFEAVQGRLGLVIGRSPMMVEVVEEFRNGVVVRDWTVETLVTTLNALTPEDVFTIKTKSHTAARQLSAEAEGQVFLKQLQK